MKKKLRCWVIHASLFVIISGCGLLDPAGPSIGTLTVNIKNKEIAKAEILTITITPTKSPVYMSVKFNNPNTKSLVIEELPLITFKVEIDVVNYVTFEDSIKIKSDGVTIDATLEEGIGKGQR